MESASDHKYSIVVKWETAESNDTPVAGQNGGQSSENSGSSKPTWVKGLVAYNSYVKPFVSAAINHQIQTISLRTGADEQQQRIQFAYDIGKQAVGIIENIAVGAAIGSLPGALIGATLGVATTLINYANRANTLRYEQNLESVTLRGMNVRAGGYTPSYAASRSRTQ